MVYNNSTYYYRFFDEIEDRLDFVFNNPKFDYLNKISQDFAIERFGEKVDNKISFSKIFEEFTSGTDYKGANYPETGEYYFRAGDINEDNELEVNENTKFVPDDFITKDTPVLEAYDILIVKDGATTGKIGIVPPNIKNKPFNTHIYKLKPKENKYLNKYLFYYLKSNIGIDLFEKYISGAAQGGITKEAIYNLFVIQKSIPDQKRILEKIEPLEKEVAKLKRELKKKKEEADNLIYKFLGFENYKPQKYFFKEGKDDTISFWLNFEELNDRIDFLHYHPKHKLINELSKEIKLIQVKEILTSPINKGCSPDFSDTGIIPCLKTVDLKNMIIDFDNSLKVEDNFYEKNLKFKTKKNDIILASTGFVSMGKVDVIPDDIDCLITGELLGLSIDLENYDPYFITFFLRSDFGQSQIEKYWTGSSGQIHLNPNEVEKIFIPSSESISKSKQKEISEEIQKAIKRSIEIEDKIQELKEKIKYEFEKELFNK